VGVWVAGLSVIGVMMRMGNWITPFGCRALLSVTVIQAPLLCVRDGAGPSPKRFTTAELVNDGGWDKP